MKEDSKSNGRMAKLLGFFGIGLCALCCAIPFAGAIGSVGLLSGITLYSGKIALVLAAASITVFVVIRFYRKRKTPACTIDCDCKTETK